MSSKAVGACRCDSMDGGRGDLSAAECQHCGKSPHGTGVSERQNYASGGSQGATTGARDIPPRNAQAQSHPALAESIPDDPPLRAPANSISVPPLRAPANSISVPPPRAPANSLSIPPGQSRYSAAAIPGNPRGQLQSEDEVPEAPEDDPALTGPLGLRGDREGDEVFLKGVMERLAGVERRGSASGTDKG